MKFAIAIAIVFQLASLAILIFGDIGFDKPGRYGLSFDHGVLFTLSYCIALLAGLASAIKNRRWKIAVLQIAIPIMIIAYDFRPVPFYPASEYQHLVGKSKEEVQSLLSPRLTHSGMVGDEEFTRYQGMMVFYDDNDIVVRVTDNWSLPESLSGTD